MSQQEIMVLAVVVPGFCRQQCKLIKICLNSRHRSTTRTSCASECDPRRYTLDAAGNGSPAQCQALQCHDCQSGFPSVGRRLVADIFFIAGNSGVRIEFYFDASAIYSPGEWSLISIFALPFAVHKLVHTIRTGNFVANTIDNQRELRLRLVTTRNLFPHPTSADAV